MGPSLGCLGIAVFRIREAHPADEDFPALLVTEALRSVEIEAMVQLLEIRGLPAAIGIRREPEDTILVYVFILVSILRHALRTAQQENLLVQFEKHRALPHIPEAFRSADHLPEGEIFQIVPTAFIDQGAAAGVPGPRSVSSPWSHNVPSSCAAPGPVPVCTDGKYGTGHCADRARWVGDPANVGHEVPGLPVLTGKDRRKAVMQGILYCFFHSSICFLLCQSFCVMVISESPQLTVPVFWTVTGCMDVMTTGVSVDRPSASMAFRSIRAIF